MFVAILLTCRHISYLLLYPNIIMKNNLISARNFFDCLTRRRIDSTNHRNRLQNIFNYLFGKSLIPFLHELLIFSLSSARYLQLIWHFSLVFGDFRANYADALELQYLLTFWNDNTNFNNIYQYIFINYFKHFYKLFHRSISAFYAPMSFAQN